MPDLSKIAAALLLRNLLTLDHEQVPQWLVTLAKSKPTSVANEPDEGKIAAAKLLGPHWCVTVSVYLSGCTTSLRLKASLTNR